MKHTPFYALHQQLGAKIVEFGGYAMPVMYSSIIEEHKTVRSAVGMFDVSHMGEFEIRGSDALALVQRVTTNDASKLSPGKVQYSAMCYPDGGIVDDLLVYNLGGDRYMLVVNASNLQKDFDWIVQHKGALQAEVIDQSEETSLLAVQGPSSLKTLQKLTATDLSAMPYYTSLRGTLAGVEMLISRTGYTGEVGFELYFDASPMHAERVWTAIMDAGMEYQIRPIGLGARDTLRLEMGFCLYGNDIDQTTNPLEAGLAWITKLDKESFVGKEVLVKVKGEGPKRKLIGFSIAGAKAFPRHGYEIRVSGRKAGVVTSGTISPMLERGIGLGYVDAEALRGDGSVSIVIREREIAAQIVKYPFITK
jgi:aminomethyltransferase